MYDVIVVGGGMGGLLSALALSKEGRNVLLLEKEDYLGGVCRSYSVDGYQVDTGPHVVTRLDQGPFKHLMDCYFDVLPKFVPHGKYYVRLNNKVRPFPWNMQALFSFDSLPQVDRLYLMKTLFTFSYLYKSGKGFSKKSVGEIIGKDVSAPTLRFLDFISYFLTGNSVNEVPLERFIDNQHYKSKTGNVFEKLHNLLMKEGAVDQAYVKGGMGSLVSSIVSSMPKSRVEIRTGEEVVKIDAGKKTVETKRGEYAYRTLVYSAFVSDAPSLIDGMAEPYGASLRSIPKVKSLSVWLGLSEPLFRRHGSEFWIDCDPYTWALPISNYDHSLAPKGRQLVGFAFMPQIKAGTKKEKKRGLDAIISVMPEIEKKIEMAHYQVLVPEKAALSVNTQYADIKTPYEGLYFVGTDTESRSAGIAKASYSVIRLLDILRKDKVI
jgi:phytoene dehydrogenase-like protein